MTNDPNVLKNQTKMWRLLIQFRKTDKIGDALLRTELMALFKKADISGATEWSGIGGYGKHGKYYQQQEGISMDAPMMLEVIDEVSKIKIILPMLKDIVNDHGLISIHEVIVV